METKSFKFTIKAIEDDGTFSGYAAVFDNVDYAKDVIEKGAFTKTLLEKKTFPLFWQHNGMKIPVGDVTAEQDEFGLKVGGLLYINDFEGKPLPEPRQLHMSLKRRAVKGMSVGYDAIVREFREDVRYLKEIKLYEVSITPWPIQDLAQVTDVKALEPAGILAALVKMEAEERFSTPEAKAMILEARKALDALLGGRPETTTDPVRKPQDTPGEPASHSLAGLCTELSKFKSVLTGGN